jgi:hypothetical protein
MRSRGSLRVVGCALSLLWWSAAGCGGDSSGSPASGSAGGASGGAAGPSAEGGAAGATSGGAAGQSTGGQAGAGAGGATAVSGCGDALPDVKATVCSTAGTTHALLTVHNECPALTVEMFWMSYACVETSYGTIAPGGTFQSNSFLTHPWRLRDAETHVLLKEIPALTAPTELSYP